MSGSVGISLLPVVLRSWVFLSLSIIIFVWVEFFFLLTYTVREGDKILGRDKRMKWSGKKKK